VTWTHSSYREEIIIGVKSGPWTSLNVCHFECSPDFYRVVTDILENYSLGLLDSEGEQAASLISFVIPFFLVCQHLKDAFSLVWK